MDRGGAIMTKYGWYSAKMDELCGVVRYELVDGGQVDVTTVTDQPDDSHTKWNDIVMVGALGPYVSTSNKRLESTRHSIGIEVKS